MPRGLPRTALIGAASALAALALFFGDGSTYPPVVWIDNEMDHELLLASNFRSFIERLTPSEGFPE